MPLSALSASFQVLSEQVAGNYLKRAAAANSGLRRNPDRRLRKDSNGSILRHGAFVSGRV